MRDFSWKYFTMTGDLESYLLFKEFDKREEGEMEEEIEGEREEGLDWN